MNVRHPHCQIIVNRDLAILVVTLLLVLNLQMIVMHNNYYAELSGLQAGHTLFNGDGIYIIAIFFRYQFVGYCMARSMSLTGQYRTDCFVTRYRKTSMNPYTQYTALKASKYIPFKKIKYQMNMVSRKYFINYSSSKST